MPVPLRLAIIFLLFIPEGILASNMLSLSPLAAFNEHEVHGPPWYWTLGFGVSLYAMGFLNGRSLRGLDQDTRTSRWVWSTAAAYAGMVLGLLWTSWPIEIDQIYGRLGQACSMFVGLVIFFSLAHIQDSETGAALPKTNPP